MFASSPNYPIFKFDATGLVQLPHNEYWCLNAGYRRSWVFNRNEILRRAADQNDWCLYHAKQFAAGPLKTVRPIKVCERFIFKKATCYQGDDFRGQ
jgi:hypothetical protein